jgi:formylglycine-generating enzyme required for sulfatase activity
MVFVPAGESLMGKPQEELPKSLQRSHGLIRKKVYLDGYYIDKYEVTNAQYMEFVKATGHRVPYHWTTNGNKIPEGRENHPVVHVSWEDAKTYCDWCFKRLPTEAEWEKAASWDMKNGKQREYPWGDKYDPELANHCHQLGCPCNGNMRVFFPWRTKWAKSAEGRKINALGGPTAPVGQFSGDRSFFGCFDMAGNVREWVADWYRPDYYKVGPDRNPKGPTREEAPVITEKEIWINEKKCRVLRGGFASYHRYCLSCSLRVYGDPEGRPVNHGFRCAADYPFVVRKKGE